MKQEQLIAAKKIIKHATEGSSFYKEKYLKAGINPEDIKTVEDFKKLLLLQKKNFVTNILSIFRQCLMKKL